MPPQAGQTHSGGVLGDITRQMIGGSGTTRWPGLAGLRRVVPTQAGCGAPPARLAPSSKSSSASSSCAIAVSSFSDERPNCSRRSLASWAFGAARCGPCCPSSVRLLAQDRRRLRRDQRAHLVGQQGEVDRHQAIMDRLATAVQRPGGAIPPSPAATCARASASRCPQATSIAEPMSATPRHRAPAAR